MQVTINFDLDNPETYQDNQHELAQMMSAKNAYLALLDMGNYIRELYKWSGKDAVSIDELQEKWISVLENNKVDMDVLE